MSALGFIILAIFIWGLFNFVTKFILPLYRTTQRIKQQFRDIRDKQNSGRNEQPTSENATKSPAHKKPEGEYIEFEEIKES
jgi:hypothetical protein